MLVEAIESALLIAYQRTEGHEPARVECWTASPVT